MNQGPRRYLRMGRIIASALAGGVCLFLIITWFLTDGGQKVISPDPFPQETGLLIWAVAAFMGFVASLFFLRRAMGLREGPGANGQGGERAAGVHTNLIISWAALEGPALLGGVFFLLTGWTLILWSTALLYLIGVMITFPREEWYG